MINTKTTKSFVIIANASAADPSACFDCPILDTLATMKPYFPAHIRSRWPGIVFVMRIATVASVVFSAACFSSARAAGLRPIALRCDYAINPLGVDSSQPRLFWQFGGTSRGARQTAYQILVASSEKNLSSDRGDLWDSGKIVSSETTQIHYAGKKLMSAQQIFWKVRAWDERGKISGWSKTATWTMGVLSEPDPTSPNDSDAAGWKAKWITALDTNAATLLFRREFVVKPGLRRALANICGLGEYELTLNGKKAGDDFFPPGWTEFDKTCLYDTRDITPLLRAGKNAVGIFLGTGMYHVVSESNRFTKFKRSFGPLKAIAQIRLDYNDGSVEFIGTDDSWRTSPGPITFCSVYGGEDFDARLVQRGWDEINFDEHRTSNIQHPTSNSGQWNVAQITDGPGGELKGLSCAAPPIRAFEIHKPIASWTLTNGDIVFDLGQNASHMFRFTATGRAGTRIRIFPAELTNADGSITQGSMGAGRRGQIYCDFIKATDGAENFAPKFFYVGCRYLQAKFISEKTTGAAKIKSIEAPVVHSASEPVGEFECSNTLFNRIRKLVRWAQRSNMMSILTDCPHRERLGWLEQDHLNGPSLRYEFDLAQLFTKTLNDIADSQLTNGVVPTTAPEYAIFRDKNDPDHLRNHFGDSPEWGATFLLAPWQQYEFDGDLELFRAHFDAMKNYVAYLGTRATNNILDYGLGDWYDLGPGKPGISQLTPIALTATAFYFDDAKTLSRAAALLGKMDDAKTFSDLAENIRVAFNEKFYNASNHTYATDSQCANAIPLVMGICEPSNRTAVVEAIVADVRAHGNTTGDVGYRYLLRALADGGRSDVIFEMNNQTNKPGYGYQLAHGKTSLTEAWNGGSSQDHFMLGQIEEWFYHDLAGIRPDPDGAGFKKIQIAPQVVGDVTWVKASYDSIRGKIVSDWKRDGNKFTLRVKTPANTTATIFLPAKSADGILESGKPAEKSQGVKLLRMENGCAVYAVESGKYEFEAKD
jgi:alpha-L-rhamnosidase